MGRQAAAPMNRVDYDVELQKHNEVLRRAYRIGPNDHVLDIGCGSGQTTREAARFAAAGRVVGVDKSLSMIERARQLTETTGLHNVSFLHADAETHDFPAESFDIAISRFGTMFFADPITAFANVARALRPGGRLEMMVWQQHDRNEWSVLIERALATVTDAAAASPPSADPFSLADPTTTERILVTAGLVGVSFTDVHEPVYYGPDVASALAWIRGFSSVNDVLQRQTTASTELFVEGLRQRLAARASADGIWIDSRAWIVGAHAERGRIDMRSALFLSAHQSHDDT